MRSTIDLAHNLGLSVVAEGVEDAEALAQLTLQRCDEAQGFHFSPPLPVAEFAAWVRQRPARPGGPERTAALASAA